ncbi:MAG TPA: anion transporter [Rectinemataceae bacterium]|nr:anion transporter [Rectinemataceae bacterium]
MPESIIYLLLAVCMVGIALGRLPLFRMNRASIALVSATLLIAFKAITLDQAAAAIDLGTIVLLLAMMLVVANLRLAGFFSLAGARILAAARGPRQLLALVILASGFLSALFLNDTVCLMLTPLVGDLALRSRRDPLPYLIALATAANVGSCATIVGNPQNMLIGAASKIPFGVFFSRLGPPSLLGLAVCWVTIALAFPDEFRKGQVLLPPRAAAGPMDRRLAIKSLAATLVMLALLLAGVSPALSALVAATTLLITRRIAPEKVFAEVDFTLLVFFASLFVVTAAFGRTPLFAAVLAAVRPFLEQGGTWSRSALSLFTLAASNLVSNVPTVMLLRPLVDTMSDRTTAWLLLAMASTYAGNLTLLGSVANLIVAEGARPLGIRLSFGSYLKAGVPITLLTAFIGNAWLLFVHC